MQKVTPTAHLLLPADAPRDAWLAARRDGITATDLPAILGLSKYKTGIDVWMNKLGMTSEDIEIGLGENEAALWGIALEDVVARTWAEHRDLNVRRVGIIAHEQEPWARASLDRLVSGCADGRCAVEVKTRSGYVADEWSAGVPADVLAQVRWQLYVSGLDHIHVIALIGGQRLIEHTVELDLDTVDEMLDPARIVWQAVASGEAPVLPPTVWTDSYLDQLHGDRAGEVEVDQAAADVALEYQHVVEQIKTLETRKGELRTQLVGALGDAEIALYSGKPIYTFKTTSSRRWDSKTAAELYPDAIGDDRCYQITQTRTLRLSTTKGNS